MAPRKLKAFILSSLLLVLSVGLVAFSAYLLSLDKRVRDLFAGARWQLPAQVYAAPAELYPGLNLEKDTLRHELARLGYRESAELQGPGTYAVTKAALQVQTRAFDFWDGPQPSLQLGIKWSEDGNVGEVYDLEAGAPRDIVRLDPMLIGSIYPKQGEDRVLVKLSEVPELMTKGLLAVEDQGFRHHFGVSPKGILRASIANMRAGRVVQGGSTLTQQLVKNFFFGSEQTWQRKINEAFMSVLLEVHYSKDEILEAYLNEVHLGQDGNRAVHGFGLGAQFYFNKPLGELQPHEVALLVGLVKGPSFYNPRRNPKRALERRNLVLDVFREEGLITEPEHAAAIKLPLGLAGGRSGVERYPAFVELVKRQLEQQYRQEDLVSEGLRIFTTLEPRAQESLERRISAAMPQLEKARKMKEDTLEAAGVVTSVDGGEVLALVGGRDTRYAGFNRALDSRRSIGSLAKPFVYLTALMHPDRFNVYSILPDEPITLEQAGAKPWSPMNYDRQLHGPQPLVNALAQSYNLPTVYLGLQFGPKATRDTLVAAGYSGNAAPVPSMFLGAVEISPLEVAQMYGTLAAGGYQASLSSIRQVQTLDRKPLSQAQIKLKQTLPEGPVYLLNWTMQSVLTQGTARSAYSVLPGDRAYAGKTGTTDDYRDSWFAGFGADRVAVIWVGRDDNKPTGLSGANGALPIWSQVMKDLNARGLDPVPPPDVEEQLVDPASGLKADEGCPGARSVPYIQGRAPEQYAPCAHAAESAPMQWLRDIFE
ncbi:penicillin-binding protein 1B [Solimonas sp. SE-A11]|uniref:penicillin-binding protein 1B n=1 Tax=Solimonas sp. SE-A11 TaxID=3054954 RepID=UPI00259D07E6|nr:penicillin-binding protein 1B [Solimonas sp. SE-A11]MDM4770075.1 penicillin-binding protein 1B [Solimonas sp. SE-A11]